MGERRAHEGSCYCPNCGRSFDREQADRYADFMEASLQHVQERLANVLDIAMRGYGAVVGWIKPKGGTDAKPVAWECPSCRVMQKVAGPCQNRECIPGEVARALAKETRVERMIAARPTPEERSEPHEITKEDR